MDFSFCNRAADSKLARPQIDVALQRNFHFPCIRERVPRAREPQRQRMSDRKLMLFSSEIFTASCSRERVRRAMDFVLRQGKILPVEGVYIAVLDRHRAIF